MSFLTHCVRVGQLHSGALLRIINAEPVRNIVAFCAAQGCLKALCFFSKAFSLYPPQAAGSALTRVMSCFTAFVLAINIMTFSAAAPMTEDKKMVFPVINGCISENERVKCSYGLFCRRPMRRWHKPGVRRGQGDDK